MASIPNSCNDCHYMVKTDNTFRCSNVDAEHEPDISLEEMYSKCPQKEDVLDAVRYRAKYRDENLYITITFLEGKHHEIFADHPTNSDPKIGYMLASWDSVTRLASLGMREFGVDKIIRQLKRSSRQPNDLPGILSNLLEKSKIVSGNLILKSRSAL